MEFHPIADIFPLMSPAEYSDLCASINAEGFDARHPIWLHQGMILDGRNRWNACAELGVQPILSNWDGTDPLAFVVKENLTRRQLNEAQRALVAGRLANMPPHRPADKDANLHTSRASAAALLNVSERSVASAAKVLREADPALIASVDAGRLSVSTAARLTDESSEVQREIAQRVADGEKPSRAVAIVKSRTPVDQLLAADCNLELHHADAFTFLPMLSPATIGLVVTDPPYNTTSESWDRIGTDDEYIAWTLKWMDALKPALRPKYHLFVFCAPDYAARMEAALVARGWPLKSRVIWEYRNLVQGRDVRDRFIQNWQMCFHFGTHPLNWSADWNDARFSVQNHAAPQTNFTQGKYHIMEKPLDLLKLLITVGSVSGDTVLDPFAGGGSTGEACQQLDRACILVEREMEFCSVISSRLGVAIT